MTLRRNLLLLALAVAGYGALHLVFPCSHPAAGWGQTIDRTSAVELARSEAQRQGLDVGNWRAGVESSLQRNSDSYLLDNPNAGIAPLLSPTVTVVTLGEASGSSRIDVRLANDGRVIGWERVEQKPKNVGLLSEADARSRSEAALLQLTGSSRARFVSETDAAAGVNLSRFSWQLNVPDEPRVKVAAVIDIENGILRKASLNPVFSRGYLEALRSQRRVLNALTITWPIFLLLGMLLCLIYYLLNIVRREVRHRSTLLLFAGFFFVISVWNLSSNLFDDAYFGFSSVSQLRQYYLASILASLVVSLLTLVFAAPMLIVWGAGYPFSARQKTNPLKGLEAVLQGRVWSRLTGRNVVVGIALGWVIPLLTLVISSSGLFRNSQLQSPDLLAEMMSSRAPLLTRPTAAVSTAGYLFLVIYVFLIPLFSTLLRRPLMVRLIAVFVGACCVTGASVFQSSVVASWICAAALLIFLDQVTYRVDIVAALAALVAGDFAVKLSTLVAQPGLTLHSSGLRGWALLTGAFLLAGYIAIRGRELSEAEANPVWISDDLRINRIDHERLTAEFDVARRAQQQMLPEEPPAHPGIEISAVCRPAREVGGDLYDFIHLPDDRLGIVVADVSGKGVPASLYMTLTKGLLASISESTSDPGEILREVNRHLYVACAKKMFVTLLLGVVDPSGRTFSYARAGHNPPVWRQSKEKQTTLLRARGLGLGLNAGDVFNRALTVETIQLAPFDKLVLYSDGITEAMNEERVEYGEERLMELSSQSDALNAEQLRDAILADMSNFLGATPPQDDQTLVVVQVC